MVNDSLERITRERPLLAVAIEQCVRQAPQKVVIDSLERHGCTRSSAEEIATEAQELLEGSLRIRERWLLRSRWMMDVYRALYRCEPLTLDEHDRLEVETFYGRYYLTNRPVVLRQYHAIRNQVQKWTPEYLDRTFGELGAEIMMRHDDPAYRDQPDLHRHVTTFGQFLQLVMLTPHSNDVYMVAHNANLIGPLIAMLDDIEIDEDILSGKLVANLWLGPKGTVTPLHHDDANNLFLQIHGSKRVLLISPCEGESLYNESGVYSPIRSGNHGSVEIPGICWNPDSRRHPTRGGCLVHSRSVVAPLKVVHWT